MGNKVNILEATINELHNAIETGDLSATTIVAQYIERIRAFDQNGPKINSIITLNKNAEKRGRWLDDQYASSGFVGPLHGIPVLVKDQVSTADIITTYGSEAFASYVPNEDATIIRQLHDAGAIILAKTNLPDWAAGFVGYSSVNGQTKNPYALDRDPGGSSAGTAAGLAANFGTVGIGEDTGGSIRVPASCCNLYGLRPTTGLVSRDGISPLVIRQDTAGPMGRTVADVARLFSVLTGFDPQDERTGAVRMVDSEKPYQELLSEDALKSKRVGVLRDRFGDDTDPKAAAVNDVVSDALEHIVTAGAELVDPVNIPDLSAQLRRSSLHELQPKHDINMFLAGLDDPPAKSVAELYESGAYHSSLELFESIANGPEDPTTDSHYWESVAAQESLRETIRHVLASHELDALIFPDVQVVPPKYAELHSGNTTREDYPVNTVISSQSACPSISIPAGLTEDRLPIGVELLAEPYSDARLLAMAYAFEQHAETRHRPEETPPLA